MHDDVMVRDVQMIITINMKNNLIQCFLALFSVEKIIRITNFVVRGKKTYDRGDASCCILLLEKSLVENIPQICKNCKLLADTSIQNLLASTHPYLVGSIATLVINCHRNNRRFELTIKDRETIDDTIVICFIALKTLIQFFPSIAIFFFFQSFISLNSQNYKLLSYLSLFQLHNQICFFIYCNFN